MALTPAGQRLLPWAARLREQAEQARHETATEHPTVRLGALESLAATHLPPLLAQLADRRPELRVTLQIGSDRGALLADLVSGTLDATLLLDTAGALGGLGFPSRPPTSSTSTCATSRSSWSPPPTTPGATTPACAPPTCSAPGCWSAARSAPSPSPDTGTSATASNGCTPAASPSPAPAPNAASAWPCCPSSPSASNSPLGTLAPLHLADPPPPLRLRLVWRRDEERARPGLRDVLYGISGTAGAAG